NRGGLLVSTDRLQGFVPVSHLVDLTKDNLGEVDDWAEAYIGQSLKLKIIECDRERGRVVLSERAALAESGSRNQLLQHLQAGNCITGTVTNITDFGVFVDLGGVEGLIHVSEISWGRVRHPSDVVRYGETLKVYVIQVDQDRSRVALSLKRLSPNPWVTAEDRYYPGLVTEAVITSIVPFGAFARLEEGLDGLIHISEISHDNEHAPLDELFFEGQKVQVRVLHVDAINQRLGLSTNIEA
ncbi:MAG: 30S ribosomal protein S1, partial [Anaerolineales bacterium]